MPAALEVNWPVLQVEFSHGVSISELARKYGVSEGTIKARSARHQWITSRPSTHATGVAGLQGDSATGLQPTSFSANLAHGATSFSANLAHGAQAAGQSLQEAGQAYAARVFKKVSSLVDQANLPPPKNWKDAEIADKIARRAAGLDTADVQITTVVGMGGMAEDPVFEAQTVDITTLPTEPTE